MSAEIAEEILDERPERMRALICIGGNPVAALPDQARAEAAMRALDLLIVIDPRLTATSRLADYVLAPKLQYERADHSGSLEILFEQPYAHVTPAIVEPPAGSDLVEDWQVFWSLAKSCGVPMQWRGEALDMEAIPTAEALFERQAAGSRVPFAHVKADAGGGIYTGETVRVGARRDARRFLLLPADVAEELAMLAAELPEFRPSGAFQMTVRRHRETMNSTGADFDATWQRIPGNPAYFHPEDVARLGLAAGELVEIVREGASLVLPVEIDPGVRPGVVSVGHCRPGTRERPWEATNALVDADNGVQAINRMPVMTGMEVEVRRLKTISAQI